MNQLLVESPMEINYSFNSITDESVSAKDSHSFNYHGLNYIIATNIDEGGLVVFYEDNTGLYRVYDKVLVGWTKAWCPHVLIFNKNVIVFFCDTGGQEPWWKTQRIKYMNYSVEARKWSNVQGVMVNNNKKGIIDPSLTKIGCWWYLFYVVMDWNATDEGGWEWWDIYYSVSQNPFGPYSEEINLSEMTEYGIEEAPFVNHHDNMLYWSVKDSNQGSVLRRGWVETMKNPLSCGALMLEIAEDYFFCMAAEGSPTCTHPDSHNGKLRATLRSGNKFYIGELA